MEVPMPAIPEGFATITPTLVLKDAAKAVELYKKAFGATEIYRMDCPDTGRIAHACLQIGSSRLFLCDVNPEGGCATASNSSFYLYFNDVDAAFRQAAQAGMQEAMPVQDMFWGDRVGNVKDAFGVQWTLATHVRDVSPQEMAEGMKKMMAKNKAA
jgi:uncharacterized glyoxalase superfamily protein PhnB